MSKSMHSPAARLLQNSRLFSLPRPLPPPNTAVTAPSGLISNSESATHPYPTYQAIATPPASLHRGDWGLKRPLPRKAAASSTPHVRIKAQDTIHHYTDYESAADHTQTQAKWSQMGVPIVVKPARTTMSRNEPTQSAYDDSLDNTDPNNTGSVSTQYDFTNYVRTPAGESIQTQYKTRKIWKHKGPFIGRMEEGAFEEYLHLKIAHRKGEFRDFMLQRMIDQRIAEERAQAMHSGTDQTLSSERLASIRNEASFDYDHEMQRLREEHSTNHLNSALTRAITDFLDLPPVHTPPLPSSRLDSNSAYDALYASTGPTDTASPTTHPAAGLSYLRTNAILSNHPIYGPQARAEPILARVLQPRSGARRTTTARLGVAGVTAKDTATGVPMEKPRNLSVAELRAYPANIMSSQMQRNLVGGNKMWVHPKAASVDAEGRIQLEIERAGVEAVAVRLGEVDKVVAPKDSGIGGISGGRGELSQAALKAVGRKGGFGFGGKKPILREKFVGFDDVLQSAGKRSAKDGEGEKDDLAGLKELFNSMGGKEKAS